MRVSDPQFGVVHKRIWQAIDAIAAKRGLSPSGLAIRAGLNATSFNLSKRMDKNGNPRWPSTQTLIKALHAADCTLIEFAMLIAPKVAK